MATKKKATANTKKEPIRLRERLLPSGNKTLYLDIYRDGKREYEYLKLYLVPEKTSSDKLQNKETLATAQAIKATRQVELQNGEFGFTSQFKLNTPFLDYYRKMCEERQGNPESRGNWGNWFSCLKHLERYCTEKTTFKDVTTEWVEGFKDYLDNVAKDAHKRKNNDFPEAKPLSQNSKVSYFNKLRACINNAFDERIIAVNPLRGVVGFKDEETERSYLTFDEVRQMAKAECRYPVLKRAFLFSCLTGLRKSDIEKMLWAEVQKFGNTTRIIFKQKKTRG